MTNTPTTGDWDIKQSPFFKCPEKFLKMGQKVRAKIQIWDLPGEEDPGPLVAEIGDIGIVVHVERSCWPTVRFSKRSSDVCDFEVEPV